MKNMTKTLLVVMALVLTLAAFTACIVTPECTHQGGMATCEEAAVCELCGESYGEALGHVEETAEQKDPTCSEAGHTEGTKCSICGKAVSGMEEIPKLPHTYDGCEDTDCNVCEEPREAGEHTYDNACDAECNVCEAERTPAAHVYDNACDANCNVCGEGRTPAAHVYDNACDAECNVCGEGRTPAAHVYDNACDANCNVCGEGRTPAAHVYDNACDAECNVCKATRTVGDHVYSTCDDTTCDECGYTRAKGEHTYDDCTDAVCNKCNEQRVAPGHNIVTDAAKAPTCEESGLTEGQHCTVCDYKIAQTVRPALNHDYDYVWSADNSTCTATCKNDAKHTETATVSVVALSVSKTKVTYTYKVDFANATMADQEKSVDGEVALVASIATIDAPAIANRVASHDYVKFGFYNAEATYTFDIYYSEVDVWDGTTATAFASGTGTENDPYIIKTGAQLAYLAKLANDGTAAADSVYGTGIYYKLGASLDLSGHQWTPIAMYDTGYKWTYFDGNFDGAGHKIIFNISNTSYGYGLFEGLGAKSVVKNLALYGSVAVAHRAGALAYMTQNGALIENVTNYASITTTATDNAYAGGLIGVIKGTATVMKNCVNYGTIACAGKYVGGLVGGPLEGTVDSCINYGSVTVKTANIGQIGGLIGSSASGSAITNSDNYGTVTGVNTTGGIAGLASGKVENCNNYGAVNATSWNIGGIAGRSANTGSISNCNNYGTIKTTGAMGGIAGTAQSNVTGCTNYGTVTGTNSSIGGIVGVGEQAAVISNCTNNGTVNGTVSDIGGILGKVGSNTTCTITNSTNNGTVNGICTTTKIAQITSDNNIQTDCVSNGSVVITDHNMTHHAAVKNDCEKDGNVEYWYCSVCKKNYDSENGGNVIADVVLAKTGHNYNDGVTENGITTFTCQNDGCGHSYTQVADCTVTVNHLYIDGSVAAKAETLTYSYNSIQTINAKTIEGYVASHDYVKVHMLENKTVTIYYSKLDVWDGTSVSESLSGEGTEESPYLIQSGADLAYIAKVVNEAADSTANFQGIYFKMTKSINLGDKDFKIGLYSKKVFHGYFDGNNCSIRGLNNTQSLFGTLKDGYIKNLSVYGSVTSTTGRTGGVVSYMTGATVENVTNYVTVNGSSAVGGVVGWMENNTTTSIVNCVNYGNVNATSYQIGGIAGNAKGNISGCTNFADVTSTGSGYVGGIGGTASGAKGSRSDCVNYGNISGTDYVGGCFGIIEATTTDCYSYGTAKIINSTKTNVGEVVGSGASNLTYTEE